VSSCLDIIGIIEREKCVAKLSRRMRCRLNDAGRIKRAKKATELEKKWKGTKTPRALDYYRTGVRKVVSGGLPELGKRR